MKIILVFVITLAFGSASVFRFPTEKPPLQHSLEKIIGLLPISRIQVIVQSYVDKGDAEVIEIYNYVHSGRLEKLVQKIYNNPKVQEQIHELETKGVRISKILEAAQDFITNNKDIIKDIEIKKPDGFKNVPAHKQERNGVSGLTNEILSVIPVDKILPELIKLYLLNNEVQIIYEQLKRKECYEIAQEVLGWGEVRSDLQRLQTWGVDVNEIIIGVEGLLGWPSNEIPRF